MSLAVVAEGSKAITKASPREELRVFRSLVRSLSSDAAKALDELEMWCTDADQLERCYLVRHYLDYMRRLCDGRV
jgi:hypothetical protein